MSPNKDLVETALIYKPDVAAGVVNAFYANGSTLVKPEFLRDARLASSYESNDALRKLNRDVAKFCVRDGKCECLFAFEIQSSVDADMPVRVYGYDGVAYRDQLDNPTLRAMYELGGARVAPVFTLVLYFGAELWRRWRTLSERATMSDDFETVLKPHFNDLEIQVVDFAGMNDEELAKYPNDIRIVAEYFRSKRIGGEFEPSKVKIVHFKELAQFMRFVVGDERFAYELVMEGYEKEPEYMCEILDRIESRGEKQGIVKGEKQGIVKGEKQGIIKEKKRSALKFRHEKGWSVEEIADFLDVDVADVEIWLNEEEGGSEL